MLQNNSIPACHVLFDITRDIQEVNVHVQKIHGKQSISQNDGIKIPFLELAFTVVATK